MTSNEIKSLLIERCSYANGYVGAVYETPNLSSADVIAVRFGGKTQEYEIKVSRSDLIGEMRCARVAAGLEGTEKYISKQVKIALSDDLMTDEQREVLLRTKHTLSKTKLEKHRFYLDPTHKEKERYPWGVTGWVQPKGFVPNTFYWCIPYELLEVCKELNAGLPYGIYVYNMPQKDKYYQKFIVKGARSLNGQGDKLYFELFNRACTLWRDDRDRVKYLESQKDKNVG